MLYRSCVFQIYRSTIPVRSGVRIAIQAGNVVSWHRSAAGTRWLKKGFAALFLLGSFALFGQSESGELHLRVSDPSGQGVRTVIHVLSEANRYRAILETNEQG